MNPTAEEIEEIIKEYKSQIRIPGKKLAKQIFLCPVGLTGAGKTTVLKLLSEKLNLVRISGDEIRKILKERGFGYDTTWKIGQTIIKEYARNGYSIAHDADCATQRTQDSVKKIAQEIGATIMWIHINPPESFILNKLSNLEPNWLGTAEARVKNYHQRKPLHENLDMNFTYTFDTSKDNLDEQIEEATNIILSKINSNSG